MATFNTSQFSWNPKTHQLTAEASDLPGFTGRPIIDVKSENTGKWISFQCIGAFRNEDWEIAYWEYVPRTSGPNIRIIIIND